MSPFSIHLYTGRERDPETGIYHYRTRPYGPHVGRFLTRDWIEYDGDTFNLYEYVRSRPTYYVDPSGLHGGPLPKPKCGKCPNEVEYDPFKQCCEDDIVVNKVPIWTCKCRLGGDNGWMPILGPISHSYIVCDDLYDGKTDGQFGFHPYPFDEWPRIGDPDDFWGSFGTFGPGYVNNEKYRDPKKASCRKRLVCPKVKEEKCKEGWRDPQSYCNRYNMQGICAPGENCHNWANEDFR